MNDLVALLDENKIKRIEFYRSEHFGNDNEEVWCEIELLGTDSHTMTLYRRGYLAMSRDDRLEETALLCLLKGQEFTFRTSRFRDTKTKVCEETVPHTHVRRLMLSVSVNIDIVQSLTDIHPPMEPSRYYPKRKTQYDTDKNTVLLEFTDGTSQLIEMHLDSDARMSWAEGLKIIPQLHRCFIGTYAIKKISKENLRHAELEELEFMRGSTLYTEKEMEFILNHLFRDENGNAYYAPSHTLGFFKLYGSN